MNSEFEMYFTQGDYQSAFDQLDVDVDNLYDEAFSFINDGQFNAAFLCFYVNHLMDEEDFDLENDTIDNDEITAQSMYDLAVENYESKETDQAFAYAFVAANLGSTKSQLLIGSLYETEACSFMNNYVHNMQNAYSSYKNVVDVEPAAKLALAEMCYNGRSPNGIDNIDEAIRWAYQAVEAKIPTAPLLLGTMLSSRAKTLMGTNSIEAKEAKIKYFAQAQKAFLAGHEQQDVDCTIELASMHMEKQATLESTSKLMTMGNSSHDQKAMQYLNAPHADKNPIVLYMKGTMARDARDGGNYNDRIYRAAELFLASNSAPGFYALGELQEYYSTAEKKIIHAKAAAYYKISYEMKGQIVMDYCKKSDINNSNTCSIVLPVKSNAQNFYKTLAEDRDIVDLENEESQLSTMHQIKHFQAKNSEENILLAKYYTGMDYLKNRDFDNAYRIFKQVGAHGLPSALYQQALLLADGKGVVANPELAYKMMLQLATDHNDPRAQYFIGIVSQIPEEKNRFCNYDIERSMNYLKKAAGQSSIKVILVDNVVTSTNQNTLFANTDRDVNTLDDLKKGLLVDRKNQGKGLSFSTGGQTLGSKMDTDSEEQLSPRN